MILMILREGLKKALLVILYFTQCKFHFPFTWDGVQGRLGQFAGRTARRAASNQASEFDFFLFVWKGVDSGWYISHHIQKRSVRQNSHQPCYFASIGISLIFLESGKNSIFKEFEIHFNLILPVWSGCLYERINVSNCKHVRLFISATSQI